ncbi:MAG: hemerythrin domain-containing protein [Polyangiaceae bacterium]|nr:hemerythrin domain-containing protein [Polyangiaceae bacterium]
MAKTDAFRDQHKKALEVVKAIQARLDPAKLQVDAQPVASDLAKLSGALQVHLAMEDKSLYPDLMKSRDPAAKKAAEDFSREMGGIAAAFGAYAKKWNALTIRSNAQDFVRETRSIFDALGKRIGREERELYPLADRA